MMSFSENQPAAKITAVGSLNIDLVWQVSKLPAPGETVIALSQSEAFGGKGANQAVAAARQGARVSFVGAVGDDAMGERYRRQLQAEGIGTRFLATAKDSATGCAHVYLDECRENMIVVGAGANLHLTKEAVDAALRNSTEPPVLLLTQFESPPEVIAHALDLAQQLGIRTVLNASPVNNAFEWGRFPIDTVIVNEHECRQWFGLAPEQLDKQSTQQREALLHQFRIANLIVTQGKNPTLLFNAQGQLSVPCLNVSPIDTVGAGDTFAGALAVQIANGADWQHAIAHANAAAALATLGMGAQTAMPTLKEVGQLRAKQS